MLNTSISPFVAMTLAIVPQLGFLAYVCIRVYRARKHVGAVPVTQKLLRPPGEYLRQQIDKLGEDINLYLTMAMAVPSMIMVSLLVHRQGLSGSASMVLALTMTVIFLLIIGHLLLKTLYKLRRYRLGFHGERAVGEELNRLMLDGCHVFHDVPMEKCGNVDHVVVSQAGVFAIETKTVSKHRSTSNQPAHEVTFDGNLLHFPRFKNSKWIRQAKWQADELADMLSKILKESIPVSPVLTLPGWFIKGVSAHSPVQVLPPKCIRYVALDKYDRTLSPDQISRIAAQLDVHCRSVEV